MNSQTKLRLAPLTALVIGAMVAGGIFSIPQNIAASAAPAATLMAWLITGLGMLALAFVFVNLSLRQPHLDSGVYAYAIDKRISVLLKYFLIEELLAVGEELLFFAIFPKII